MLRSLALNRALAGALGSTKRATRMLPKYAIQFGIATALANQRASNDEFSNGSESARCSAAQTRQEFATS